MQILYFCDYHQVSLLQQQLPYAWHLYMYAQHSAGYLCIQTYRTYTASFNFHIDLEINILPVKFTYWNVRFLLKVAWLVRRKTHKLNIKLIRVFNHHISSQQSHHQTDKLGVVTEQQNQIRHLLGSVGEIRRLGISCEVHLIGSFRSPFRWRAETAYASLCTEKLVSRSNLVCIFSVTCILNLSCHWYLGFQTVKKQWG